MGISAPPAGGQTPPADPSQGQTPPTSGQTPTTPPSPSEGDEQPISVAEARRLRQELKERRESEATAKAELKKHQDAQLSDVERERNARAALEAEKSTWQREMQELRVGQAVERLAAKLGIVDPEAAVKLMDWTQLDFDKETGVPTNAERVLKDLIDPKKGGKTWLAGQSNPANPTIGPTNPGQSPGQPFFTKAQIQDINFYQKNRTEILKAMQDGRIEK
jgi:hypothetical protein